MKWKCEYSCGYYRITKLRDSEWNGRTHVKVMHWVLEYREREIFASKTLKSCKDFAVRHAQKHSDGRPDDRVEFL
jgi:hypothetical protein